MDLNSKMLAHLQCPVCSDPVCRPIHSCTVGHVICASCMRRILTSGTRHCPKCRNPFGNHRLFTMEEMTDHLVYPCRTEGCPAICKPGTDGLEDHMRVCNFGAPKQTCPFFGCGLEFLAHDRVKHWITDHSPLVTNGKNYLRRSVTCSVAGEHENVIIFDQQAFHVKYKVDLGKSLFCLAVKALIDANKRYGYRVEVAEWQSSAIGRIRSVHGPATEFADLFNTVGRCFNVGLDSGQATSKPSDTNRSISFLLKLEPLHYS